MSRALMADPSHIARLASQRHSETELVARLVRAVALDGVRVDPAWTVNCYVSLKSKPLVVLVGPENSGKELLVKNLAQVLTQDIWRNQKMLGHAWWAERTGNVAFFTEAQARLNSNKILGLIEEAALPENSDHVFIGWLSRISPAELVGFFSELAFQLQNKRLMQLPGFHLTEPIACSPNFTLLGTMDTRHLGWSDEDLLSQTAIIPWPRAVLGPPANRRAVRPAGPEAERVFLRSCVRTPETALDKLRCTRGWQPQVMWPLAVVEDLLNRHHADLPGCAMGEAMIYIANAWSVDGEGLFDPAPARNLAIALDFAIAQSLLLRATETIRESGEARRWLAITLGGRFPRSVAFLYHLQGTGIIEGESETQVGTVDASRRPEHLKVPMQVAD